MDDVSLNIITLYTLFVSNVIGTHDTLLGFVKAHTMRILLHSYSETTRFDYSDTKCYCQEFAVFLANKNILLCLRKYSF